MVELGNSLIRIGFTQTRRLGTAPAKNPVANSDTYVYRVSVWIGIKETIRRAREIVGGESTPTYLTFDIDSLDPIYAPGTVCTQGTNNVFQMQNCEPLPRQAKDRRKRTVGFLIIFS